MSSSWFLDCFFIIIMLLFFVPQSSRFIMYEMYWQDVEENNDFIISFRSSSILLLILLSVPTSYSMSQCLWSSKILSSFIVCNILRWFISHAYIMNVWACGCVSERHIHKLRDCCGRYKCEMMIASRVVGRMSWKEENEKIPITRT